jgi:hypothetical protein
MELKYRTVHIPVEREVPKIGLPRIALGLSKEWLGLSGTDSPALSVYSV